MPPTEELIHMYANTRPANIKKWNDIFEFYDLNGPAIWHEKPREEKFIQTRSQKFQKYKVFACEEDARRFIELDEAHAAELVTWPERTEYKLIQLEFIQHIKFIRKILDNIIAGIPPTLEINAIFQRAIELKIIRLEIIPESWQYGLSLNDARFTNEITTIEDYVDIKGILMPSISTCATKLKFTKKCAICQKYYQAKGVKAIHCSETCRSKSRFKLTLHTQ